jgi:hypothetical protein
MSNFYSFLPQDTIYLVFIGIYAVDVIIKITGLGYRRVSTREPFNFSTRHEILTSKRSGYITNGIVMMLLSL